MVDYFELESNVSHETHYQIINWQNDAHQRQTSQKI